MTAKCVMITKHQIDNIIKTIVNGYYPEKIIMFGFYAQGNPNPDSDLDLLIIKDDNLPKIQRNRVVREYLRDLLVPVDVIVKTHQEVETLKDVVGTVVYMANKYGKVVYG